MSFWVALGGALLGSLVLHIAATLSEALSTMPLRDDGATLLEHLMADLDSIRDIGSAFKDPLNTESEFGLLLLKLLMTLGIVVLVALAAEAHHLLAREHRRERAQRIRSALVHPAIGPLIWVLHVLAAVAVMIRWPTYEMIGAAWHARCGRTRDPGYGWRVGPGILQVVNEANRPDKHDPHGPR